MSKADILRNIFKRNNQEVVYMVSEKYELLPCKILKMFDEGDIICEVEVPECFHKVFRSKTANLSWNDNRKHLWDKNLQHFAVYTMPYLFGRDMNNGKRLRRELIDLEIRKNQVTIENLIKLKYQL